LGDSLAATDDESMVDGRWPMVDGRWSMVDGRWSMVDGRWSMVDGRWSMEGYYCAQLIRISRADPH